MQIILTIDYPEEIVEMEISKGNLITLLSAYSFDDKFVVSDITDKVAQILWKRKEETEMTENEVTKFKVLLVDGAPLDVEADEYRFDDGVCNFFVTDETKGRKKIASINANQIVGVLPA